MAQTEDLQGGEGQDADVDVLNSDIRRGDGLHLELRGAQGGLGTLLFRPISVARRELRHVRKLFSWPVVLRNIAEFVAPFCRLTAMAVTPLAIIGSLIQLQPLFVFDLVLALFRDIEQTPVGGDYAILVLLVFAAGLAFSLTTIVLRSGDVAAVTPYR